jgi:hypothetical protein
MLLSSFVAQSSVRRYARCVVLLSLLCNRPTPWRGLLGAFLLTDRQFKASKGCYSPTSQPVSVRGLAPLTFCPPVQNTPLKLLKDSRIIACSAGWAAALSFLSVLAPYPFTATGKQGSVLWLCVSSTGQCYRIRMFTQLCCVRRAGRSRSCSLCHKQQTLLRASSSSNFSWH